VEQQRIEAVTQILKQLYGLSCPPRGINKIVRETIFFLYEGGDSCKCSFERPHFAAARALHREVLSRGERFGGRKSQVTYDHAIPWDTLGDSLREAATSYEKMRDFLNHHVQGVVILKEEDARLSKCKLRRRLPAGAQAHDMLARYQKAGIAFEPEDEAKLRRKNP